MPKKEIQVAQTLTRDWRLQIYKLIGEGYKPIEVVRAINKSMKDQKIAGSIRMPGLERILALPEASNWISKYQMKFLEKVKTIPIAEKKVRMDDLEMIRNRLLHLLSTLKPGQGEFSKFMAVVRRTLDVLQLARDEMEQRPNLSIGIGVGDGGELSGIKDKAIQQEYRELLNKASKALERGTQASDDFTEGDGDEDTSGSAEVFLATSEELSGEEVPSGGNRVFDA